jgi:hypothetical protein
VSRCPRGRCSGRTWTPPPLETLPPPAHSRARQLALVVLRAQLLIAVPGCLWGTSGKGGFRSGGFAGRSGASPHWRFPPSRPAWPGLRDSVPGRRRPPLRNDNRRAIFRPASTTTRSGETSASWPKEQSWCTAWRARSLLSWTNMSSGTAAWRVAVCAIASRHEEQCASSLADRSSQAIGAAPRRLPGTPTRVSPRIECSPRRDVITLGR